MKKLLNSIANFYIDGFKNMTLGKTLWLLILLKLFLMFAIVKPLFFPNYLKTNFNNDKERGDYIIDHLSTKN